MIDCEASFGLGKTPSKARSKLQEAKSERVYFMERLSSGHTKIGFTSRPAQRINAIAIQVGCDVSDLAFAGYITVPVGKGREIERALHKQFADQRVTGEWFDLSGANVLHNVLEVLRLNGGSAWPVSGLATEIAHGEGRAWRPSADDKFALVRRKANRP